MTADLRDRIARALFIEGVGPEAAGAWDAPGDGGRQRWWNYADAVIAELGPLIEERDRLRHQAEAAEAERVTFVTALREANDARATWHERWRQLMRDYEAEFKRAEAAEAENERLRILWDSSGKNDLIERAEAAEAAHKALTEAVRGLADAWEDDARPAAGRIVLGLRAILTENGATR